MYLLQLRRHRVALLCMLALLLGLHEEAHRAVCLPNQAGRRHIAQPGDRVILVDLPCRCVIGGHFVHL